MRRLTMYIVALAVMAVLAAFVWRQQFPLHADSYSRVVLGCEGTPAVASAIAQAGMVASDSRVEATALGRLEPRDGVIRIASHVPQGVIAKLFVDDGDPVKQGEMIALLDDYEKSKSEVERFEAELDNALAEEKRFAILHASHVVDDSTMDAKHLRVVLTRAQLAGARAALDLAQIRSPIPGRVLKVLARPGEMVGPVGIVELGRTDEMCAIAEVYETDIAHVHLGDRATITSPALPQPLSGRVDRMGMKVFKQDVLSTDPAARTDARVVEVRIRLDESKPAEALSYLQVDVKFLGRTAEAGR